MYTSATVYNYDTRYPNDLESEMAKDSIGELEHLILLTILNHPDAGSALRIRETLELQAQRRITRGALYRSLDRLGGKGLIDWRTQQPTKDRGGHAKRLYSVTPAGLSVVQERRQALERLWAGAEAQLGR